MKFNELELAFKEVHSSLQKKYDKSNKSEHNNSKLVNWLIGYYIIEFEQKGEDRAKWALLIITTLTIK